MNLKAISLNLWFGGRLFDHALSFLKKEKPDIVLLQEVYQTDLSRDDKRFQLIPTFQKELALPYYFYSPEFESIAKKSVFGNCIMSRFPIKFSQSWHFKRKYQVIDDRGWTDFSQHPRNLQYCQLQVDNTILNVFNVHGIWQEDVVNSSDRKKMTKTIIEKVESKKNVLLAGDFNIDERSQTIGALEKHLKNVFKNKLTTSFNIKRKPFDSNAFRLIVDFVFVSSDIDVVDYYCPTVDISDHLPLVVVFTIN